MRKLALVAAAIILAGPGPALAKSSTDYAMQSYDRAEQAEDKAEHIEGMRELYDFGACLAKARRHQVERFLAIAPFSPEARDLGKQVISRECLIHSDMRFNAEALRGPFYQALYRRDFGDRAMPDLKDAPQLGISVGAESYPAAANLRRFADCVIRQDSWSARSLLMSDFATAEEKTAFKALSPVMARCIAPGDKLSFQPALLRAMFGEVLYRLASASSGDPMPMDRKR